MRILRENDFLEGIITESMKLCCNKCKKIFQVSDKVFKEFTQIDSDFCEKCYLKEIGKK